MVSKVVISEEIRHTVYNWLANVYIKIQEIPGFM